MTSHASRTDRRPDEAGSVAQRLHEISERLWAGSNYIDALRLQLRGHAAAVAVGLADSAAREIDVAVGEFRKLRNVLEAVERGSARCRDGAPSLEIASAPAPGEPHRDAIRESQPT